MLFLDITLLIFYENTLIFAFFSSSFIISTTLNLSKSYLTHLPQLLYLPIIVIWDYHLIRSKHIIILWRYQKLPWWLYDFKTNWLLPLRSMLVPWRMDEIYLNKSIFHFDKKQVYILYFLEKGRSHIHIYTPIAYYLIFKIFYYFSHIKPVKNLPNLLDSPVTLISYCYLRLSFVSCKADH